MFIMVSKMKAKVWLISWLFIIIILIGIPAFCVYKVDPYFHYHLPDLSKYFYTLNNQRSQNDGIIKRFEYDALITGTSMTENFRTSEMNDIFGCNAIKVPFFGGSYKEINDNIAAALKYNSNLKTVVRCLDMSRFLDSYDLMRFDLGTYPSYLYDDNPFNDVEYLFNRDVFFGMVYKMISEKDLEGYKVGITSFDDYSRWQERSAFGLSSVIKNRVNIRNEVQPHLTEDEKARIKKNIELNVISVADKYPSVDFYYYYSPYSVAAWIEWENIGMLNKYLDAEQYITELILSHKNIHLFSFNNRTDITMDLNNYSDSTHYGSWVNTLILKWMYEGKYQLTEENYVNELDMEKEFYSRIDCSEIENQEDYESDYFAGALLNKELTGVDPLIISQGNLKDGDIEGDRFMFNLGEGYKGYNYLCFSAKKQDDNGSLKVCVYDEEGNVIGIVERMAEFLDNEKHRYVIDLSAFSGYVTVILNGADKPNPDYQFGDIYVY